MAAVEIDVKYVAHLARLELSPDEERKFGEQLGHILGYVEKLKELDVTNVEPTAHALPRLNVTRADATQPSLPQAERAPGSAAASGSLEILGNGLGFFWPSQVAHV